MGLRVKKIGMIPFSDNNLEIAFKLEIILFALFPGSFAPTHTRPYCILLAKTKPFCIFEYTPDVVSPPNPKLNTLSAPIALASRLVKVLSRLLARESPST